MFHGIADLIFRRCFELPIGDELDAEHETCSPHVANDCVNEQEKGSSSEVVVRKNIESVEFLNKFKSSWVRMSGARTLVLLLETTKAVLEVGADDGGVLLELLLLEHLEDGEPARGAQGVAAERVEVAAPGQHLRDLRRCHHGAQRDAVADALKNSGVRRTYGPRHVVRFRASSMARHGKKGENWDDVYLRHGHYVGDDAVGLEPPEVAADASETRLDLVGDAEPAGLPDLVVRQRQVPR